MKKILTSLFIIAFFAGCNFKKKIDHHGVHKLEEKSKKIIVSETNKNEIISLLGPPSVTSVFDNDIYIYIERKITTEKLIKLGKQYFMVNNVLILEIDNRGILSNKEFYDLKKMNNIEIINQETEVSYTKRNFIYDFLSSMRQKVNDPLGKRKKK